VTVRRITVLVSLVLTAIVAGSLPTPVLGASVHAAPNAVDASASVGDGRGVDPVVPDGVDPTEGAPDPADVPADAEDDSTRGEQSGSGNIDLDIRPAASEGPARTPLIRTPVGCEAPELPDLVFVGTVVDQDFRTARFRIQQVRAGEASRFAAGRLVDVRFGLDVQFLELGEQYLVSARQDPLIGVLYSRVTELSPNFGGDDIVGIAETDLDCPTIEDSIRTILPDGSAVETTVFGPFFESRSRLLGAVVLPFAIAFGLIFLLAMLRVSVSGVAQGARAVGRRRYT
jgi:hypothetical protein